MKEVWLKNELQLQNVEKSQFWFYITAWFLPAGPTGSPSLWPEISSSLRSKAAVLLVSTTPMLSLITSLQLQFAEVSGYAVDMLPPICVEFEQVVSSYIWHLYSHFVS